MIYFKKSSRSNPNKSSTNTIFILRSTFLDFYSSFVDKKEYIYKYIHTHARNIYQAINDAMIVVHKGVKNFVCSFLILDNHEHVHTFAYTYIPSDIDVLKHILYFTSIICNQLHYHATGMQAMHL